MLPRPTNKRLEKLFAGVNRVKIKEGGASNGKAFGDIIALEIVTVTDLKRFSNLLEIYEPKEWFHCMCHGDYAIELHRGHILNATIALHHGVSIRYNKWYGDANLTKAEELLQFLADLGFRKPLEQLLESNTRQETQEIQRRQWLDIAPNCFIRHFELQGENFSINRLEEELESEIPDKNIRIIKLLQTYACTKSPWRDYPSYEALPYQLLDRINTNDIFAAYIASDRNYNIRKGLGRYTGCYESRHKRKIFLVHMPLEIITELYSCFEKLNDTQGKNRMETLRKEKEQLNISG